jgi:hypothetical protein
VQNQVNPLETKLPKNGLCEMMSTYIQILKMTSELEWNPLANNPLTPKKPLLFIVITIGGTEYENDKETIDPTHKFISINGTQLVGDHKSI